MASAKYVDGFVLAVPKKNTVKYQKIAKMASKVWKKFGALDYKECILEDPKPPFVTMTFSKMAKLKAGETVWFSFITYKSRKHRDDVNTKVMAYFEKKYTKEWDMPFDKKRFAYGGFKVMVQG